MDYGDLSGPRVVVLDREVDDDAANRVAAHLLLLADEGPQTDIVLRIDSPGGSVTAGMAVYDVMEFIPCDVATCAVGLVAGMGQLLLSAGAPGKRCAVRDARIVMRGPGLPGPGEGGGRRSRAGFLRTRRNPGPPPLGGAELARTRRVLSELTAGHVGRSRDQIVRDWEAQREFSADEARAYGLVDRVLDLPPGL